MSGDRADIFSRHGGALDAAMKAYGGSRAEWLDLSTGINPAPPGLPDLPAHVWARLPEKAAEIRLIEAARTAYGAPRSAAIVPAPGSQALISALPHLFSPTLAAVLDPSYSEHGRSLRAAGHEVVAIRALGDVPPAATIVVVVNPNNPDGRRFARSDLLAFADALAARGGLLVVDEAFADCDSSDSLAGHGGRDGLLVHRSFGKFYGLAGLRLGFAVTTAELARRLEMRLGPWAVSGPAIAVGTAFLEDPILTEQIRAAIARQADRRDEAIAAAGFAPVGSTALFSTILVPDARAAFDALCRSRILTRRFETRTRWLRIGNPAGEADAERLHAALRTAAGDVRPPSG